MRLILTAFVTAALGANAAPAAAPSDPAARILATARHAYGPIPNLGMLIETGTEKASGLTGRFRLARDLRTGHLHIASDFGVLKGAEVWDGQHHWRQDHSGGVHA